MATSSIRDFYKGRNVLVTGGSGFMGKVLIEKLLYSVPEIGNVYILMRPKRGKSVAQRLEDMQRLPMFNRLNKERPSAFKKLKILQGDVLLEDLGLSYLDIENISAEVSVVFHFAATLRMEAPLKDNVNMNTSGTLRTLNIAKKLKALDVFVHLSTAFCYPDYEILGEKMYPPPVEPQNVMKIIELLDEEQLCLLTPSLLGPHPNCYTFSKRLAENIVEHAYKELPVVIARPSIVCPTFKEPLPGWVDSLNGPVGVMLGAGKGVIRTMLCDGSLTAQVIPADIAINAIIAIGMLEGTRKEKPKQMPIYNVNIGHQKPTTWGDVLNVAKAYGREYPLSWPLWYPNGDITTSYHLHEIRRIFYHLIPAYVIDLILSLCGQKKLSYKVGLRFVLSSSHTKAGKWAKLPLYFSPLSTTQAGFPHGLFLHRKHHWCIHIYVLVRIQNRITQGLEVLQYFTMRPWNFPCPNYDGIQAKLNGEEKVIFNTDITTADRDEYMRSCVEGGRVYCLKEDPTKVSINRAYHNFLFVLDWAVKIMFWLFILSIMASWFSPVKTLFSVGEPIVKHLPFLGAAVFNEDK